jgi:hypothetical protein
MLTGFWNIANTGSSNATSIYLQVLNQEQLSQCSSVEGLKKLWSGLGSSGKVPAKVRRLEASYRLRAVTHACTVYVQQFASRGTIAACTAWHNAT